MRTALASATFLTILFLWPVLTQFTTHLPSAEDGVLISYLIYWVAHAVSTGANVYRVPFFHPFTNTLAYSDPYLSTGLLSIPIAWFTTNLAIISNLQLVAGTVATFVGMYLLAKLVTQSKVASLISAVVFTFSSMHFHYIVHLHTYLIAGLPLSVSFFLKWVKTNRRSDLVWAATAFLYQALNAPMTAFFLAAVGGCLLFEKTIRQKLLTNWKFVLSLSLVVLAVCGVLYRPYFHVSQEFNYTRSIRDAAHFAHSLNRLANPESLLLLSLAGIAWYRGRQQAKDLTQPKTALLSLKTQLLIAAVGAILMLGPVLKVSDQTFKVLGWPIPLPYAVLYYLVPGFQAFRTSSRWIIVFNFGLSLIIGTVLVRAQLKTNHMWLITMTLISFFWLTQVPNLRLYSLPSTRPEIYELVKTRPETVLAEFPVFSWRMAPYLHFETDRYLAQIHHGKRLYNGATGFTPPERETEWDNLWLKFPQVETVELLRQAGVELVLVDFSIYDELARAHFRYLDRPSPTGSQMKQLIEHQNQLKTLGCTETACLYTIQP